MTNILTVLILLDSYANEIVDMSSTYALFRKASGHSAIGILEVDQRMLCLHLSSRASAIQLLGNCSRTMRDTKTTAGDPKPSQTLEVIC